MKKGNLHDVDEVEVVDGVHLAQLVVGEKMSVQNFRIEPGTTVPEHSHPHEQVGYITKGELTFITEDGETVVREGESFHLESDEPHGAENRGDKPVLGVDIFSPPRADPSWITGSKSG